MITSRVCCRADRCPVSALRSCARRCHPSERPHGPYPGTGTGTGAVGGLPRLQQILGPSAQQLRTEGLRRRGLEPAGGAAPTGVPVLLCCRRLLQEDLRRADPGPDLPLRPVHPAAAADPTGRASSLDGHAAYLAGRWAEGCTSTSRLHQEVRDRGARVSERTVRRFLHRLRRSSTLRRTRCLRGLA